MSENIKDADKRHSLFDRIKGSLGFASKEAPEKKEIPDLMEPLPEVIDTEIEEDLSDLGRGAMNIPSNSRLYELREEWNHHLIVSGMNGQGSSSYPFHIVLEPDGMDELPIGDMDMETEQRRFLSEIRSEAENRYLVTRPNEEGIYPDANAEVVIHIARQHMAAWAFVFPPCGEGKPLTGEDLELAIQSHAVCAGLDETAIRQMVEKQTYFDAVLIARGTPMIPGENGYIEEMFERHRETTFKMDEHGRMDYREQDYIQIVHTGDVICNIIPPTPGKAGINVMGTEIPPKDGREAKPRPGQNTVFNLEKMQILATADGMIHYDDVDGKFHIKPTFYVNGDVDLHTGNIDFPGEVIISGDVREDFVVRATGSIVVKGLVEASVIEAGEDVIIAQGVLGDDKGIIKANGSVKAGYIENAVVYAKGTVTADAIVGSRVYSDQTITVTSGRGTIIGGRLIAAQKIEAGIIGCRAERSTALIVGQLPYIQQEKEETKLSLTSINKEINTIDLNIKYLTANELETDPKKIQAAAKFRLRKSVLNMKASQLNKRLEELNSFEIDLSKCRIKVGEAYPLVNIKIGEHQHLIKNHDFELNVHLEGDTVVGK